MIARIILFFGVLMLSYIRLWEKYFILLFAFVLLTVSNRIYQAKMTGEVATLLDIEEMLNEFKSCYKNSLFSDNTKIKNRD